MKTYWEHLSVPWYSMDDYLKLHFLIAQSDLILNRTIVLALPLMPMQRERLKFWRWDAWKHSHLHNYYSRPGCSHRFDRAKGIVSSKKYVPVYGRYNSLATAGAKPPANRLPAQSFLVDKFSQRAVAILDIHLLLINDKVDGCITTRYLAAVGTMADVAAPAGEELRVVDSDVYGTAKAVAFQALRERRRGVLIRVTGELVHGYERYN
jgi:hypothetical protein